MAHTTHNQKQLLTRVRRIRGQAEALENALAQQAECVAILQQIAAIRGAVNGLMAEVLEGHIREHLGRGDVPADVRAADLEEVVAAVRSYMK
ncbi:metal/formaldehyde-sensitive transcriptional repressor [Pigmentiphaga sp.]|uniref:metal/formaldehyde-sensitive transcriptional repressor n=1 Tax=Pigmentiphaga sp. TaxID=1977564 RepID=UPI00128BC5DE|nr:metal/formaldehyde-sensitive transcriptional repressor [Pigmentiphaga sp.]MPS29852.1 metal/formaldehyde-sensitive transcriptional repressor [Alcaligenaceae bacterium SAGV5]MPS54976.1 metal/formaldehyde-sensitive transcriptional repressor [Alcaligenaceae bacterium SAGV3]MPT60222.1 metal/formaldehyde-sensitive transcriptional repressor [Alcaligenaceae bacterium]